MVGAASICGQLLAGLPSGERRSRLAASTCKGRTRASTAPEQGVPRQLSSDHSKILAIASRTKSGNRYRGSIESSKLRLA
jgi:hypothetical protein